MGATGDAVALAPAPYAALIAPVIDRLVIGVHVASRDRGRALGTEFGLIKAGYLVELRLALPVRPVTPAGLLAITRYLPSTERDAEITTQVEQGMIRLDEDGTMCATDRARAFYRDLFPLHDTVASQLWQHRTATLPELSSLIERTLAAAAESGGAAFGTAFPPYEPSCAGPALLLFNRLATLRYHRADAHAAAWTAVGLTAVQAPGQGVQRERIEAETNRLAGPPFEALDATERLSLLAGLAALPG